MIHYLPAGWILRSKAVYDSDALQLRCDTLSTCLRICCITGAFYMIHYPGTARLTIHMHYALPAHCIDFHHYYVAYDDSDALLARYLYFKFNFTLFDL